MDTTEGEMSLPPTPRRILDSPDNAEKVAAAEALWERLVPVAPDFALAISNPPYQEETGVHGNGRVNYTRIFDRFQLLGLQLAHVSCMVYPMSWRNNVSSPLVRAMVAGGLKSSYDYNGTELFGDAIMQDYPISVVLCKRGYNGDIYVNGVSNQRSGERWNTSAEEEILARRTKGYPRLTWSAHNPTDLSNMEDGGITPVENGEVTLYIKKRRGVQADASDITIDRATAEEHLIFPEAIDEFTVAMASSSFKQTRLFARIKNNPRYGFDVRVFGRGHIFAGTWMRLTGFENEEQARNATAYLNSRLITLLLTRTMTPGSFTSMAPDIGDYTSANPLFMGDDELEPGHEYRGLSLDERLHRLFQLSEDEIAVVRGYLSE